MSKLPKNWEYGKLSQAAHVVRGITFPAGEKRNDLAQGYVCCLRTTNVQQKLEWNDVYYVPTSYVKRDEQLVREGDVLMSMANSYELVGKVARAINVPQPAAFGAFLAAVRPTHAIDGGYLYHFLRSSEVQSKLREGSSQTTNIANISAGKLSELTVPLAPWNEQKRIAEKLDGVLARVDAVNTRLVSVAPTLKRFRQSVLAAATSGRLTEDWRSNRQVITAWRSCTIGDITQSSYYGPRFGATEYTTDGRGVPTIRTTDMTRKGLIAISDATPRVIVPEEKIKTYQVLPGDLLVTRTGSIGVMAVFEGDYIAVPSAYLIRFRFTSAVLPRFSYLLLAAPGGQEAMGLSTTAITQPNINAEAIKRIEVSLPTLEEQAEIIRRVEILFAFSERLETRLQTARTAIERMTPALLAKAFRGELVPQDPNDEPASELLRRLQQEAPSPRTKRGRKSAA